MPAEDFLYHRVTTELRKNNPFPAATMVTPNQFELEYLASLKINDLASALRAVDIVTARGPRVVLVTSLRRQDAADDCIEVLAVAGSEAHLIETPLLPLNVNGAGD